LTRLRNRELELTIKHEVVRGVTREMIAWWFCHIDGTMEYAGRTVPRYRVWHPYDHIAYRDLTVAVCVVLILPGCGTRTASVRRRSRLRFLSYAYEEMICFLDGPCPVCRFAVHYGP